MKASTHIYNHNILSTDFMMISKGSYYTLLIEFITVVLTLYAFSSSPATNFINSLPSGRMIGRNYSFITYDDDLD